MREFIAADFDEPVPREALVLLLLADEVLPVEREELFNEEAARVEAAPDLRVETVAVLLREEVGRPVLLAVVERPELLLEEVPFDELLEERLADAFGVELFERDETLFEADALGALAEREETEREDDALVVPVEREEVLLEEAAPVPLAERDEDVLEEEAFGLLDEREELPVEELLRAVVPGLHIEAEVPRDDLDDAVELEREAVDLEPVLATALRLDELFGVDLAVLRVVREEDAEREAEAFGALDFRAVVLREEEPDFALVEREARGVVEREAMVVFDDEPVERPLLFVPVERLALLFEVEREAVLFAEREADDLGVDDEREEVEREVDDFGLLVEREAVVERLAVVPGLHVDADALLVEREVVVDFARDELAREFVLFAAVLLEEDDLPALIREDELLAVEDFGLAARVDAVAREEREPVAVVPRPERAEDPDFEEPEADELLPEVEDLDDLVDEPLPVDVKRP